MSGNTIRSFSEVKLLLSVRSGRSVRGLGRTCKILESTFRVHTTAGITSTVLLGCKAVFTLYQENELFEHTSRIAKLFYGLTLIEIYRLAYDSPQLVILRTVVTRQKN
jgi:hypothetical protein